MNSPEAASAEREKVLSLLEQGKITASECAELLNALATEVRKPAPAAATPLIRLLKTTGMVLVMIGFFLPWFKINAGALINKLFSQLQHSVPAGNLGLKGANPPVQLHFNGQNMQNMGMEFQANGSDVKYGLGWLVLAGSTAAGALSFIFPDMNSRKRHLITRGCLFAGILALLAALIEGLRIGTSESGIFLCMTGYAVSSMGALHEWKQCKTQESPNPLAAP